MLASEETWNEPGRSGRNAQKWFSKSPHVILPTLKSPHLKIPCINDNSPHKEKSLHWPCRTSTWLLQAHLFLPTLKNPYWKIPTYTHVENLYLGFFPFRVFTINIVPRKN
jgi:hypothetical protein